MNAKQPRRIILTLIAVSAWLMVATPALSHDPLHDVGERQRGDHHFERHADAQLKVNLTEVRALLVSFRESGNDRYLDDAWVLLDPALLAGPSDPETLIVASFVAQSRHQFDYAVELISRALSINDNNDEAWLLLASIQLVRGEAESAASACRQLRDVSPLLMLTCNARVALLTGEHELAFERLNSILNASDLRRLQSDLLAWSYSVAGDLAVAAGKPDQAISLYRDSLALAERTQVRAALVDILLSVEDYENAWQALDDGSRALPLLVRRLIVARRLGRSHEFRTELSMVRREFDAWIAKEDWLHAREMARYFIDVVDDPELARKLALINIELQKEPEDQLLERRTRQALAINRSGTLWERLPAANLFQSRQDAAPTVSNTLASTSSLGCEKYFLVLALDETALYR